MSKEFINEHDITKKMFEVIRGGYKKILSEADESNYVENDNVISPTSNDLVFKDELKKLQDTVTPRVEITNFKIYPNDNNVIIDGVLLKKEDEKSGIHFRMSLAGELTLDNSNGYNIDLSDDKTNMVLDKIKGYYENWVDEWALKITNEYK